MSSDVKEQIKTSIETSVPKLYNVYFHNDDKTTFEFVIYLLTKLFGHDEPTAVEMTIAVHQNGKAIVGTYNLEVAETKVEMSISTARNNNFPLVVTCEESE